MRARGRRPKVGRMNKTEGRYAAMLDMKQRAGEIQGYVYEALKLRLADKTYYTPDFMVLDKEGYIEFHEVKGQLRDDALVKFKVAAEQYSWARWVMVREVGSKGLTWDVLYEILPEA